MCGYIRIYMRFSFFSLYIKYDQVLDLHERFTYLIMYPC